MSPIVLKWFSKCYWSALILQSRNRIDFPIFSWATKIMSLQEIISLMNSGNLIRTFLILIKTSKFLSYDDSIYWTKWTRRCYLLHELIICYKNLLTFKSLCRNRMIHSLCIAIWRSTDVTLYLNVCLQFHKSFELNFGEYVSTVEPLFEWYPRSDIH